MACSFRIRGWEWKDLRIIEPTGLEKTFMITKPIHYPSAANLTTDPWHWGQTDLPSRSPLMAAPHFDHSQWPTLYSCCPCPSWPQFISYQDPPSWPPVIPCSCPCTPLTISPHDRPSPLMATSLLLSRFPLPPHGHHSCPFTISPHGTISALYWSN